MKNRNEIRTTVILISVLFIVVFNPLMDPKFTRGYKEDLSSINNLNLDLDLSMQTGIFGYKLDVSNDNPIERDENAVIKIVQVKENFAEVLIKTAFGEFEFKDLNIEEETVGERNSDMMCRYEVENPRKGFFMEIHIMSDVTRINLAFDGGNCQLNYDAVVEKGIMDYKTLSGDSLKSADLDLSNQKTNTLKYIEYLKIHQIKNIRINRRVPSGFQLEILEEDPWKIYKYGVAHECYDGSVDLPEELWDDYWDPYTSLDYSVYRYMPTEAQVKSDLQFYNTVYTDPYQTSRRVIPYTMYTHGGPEWYIYEWDQVWVPDPKWWNPFNGYWLDCQVLIGVIYPSEISDLWYNYMGAYVYPAESLVMLSVCYGYWDDAEDPDMAEAFVEDGGADAFVGATVDVPFDDNDVFMGIFWDELCFSNEDVETATIELCEENSSWDYGEEWRIMGDTLKILPD